MWVPYCKDGLREADPAHPGPIEHGEDDQEPGNRKGEEKREQLHIPARAEKPVRSQDREDGREEDTQGGFEGKVDIARFQSLTVVFGEEELPIEFEQEVEEWACCLQGGDAEHNSSERI